MAAYTVLANRYRPRTFDDVVGQSDVARVLRSAFAAKRTGHAFLFSGPRGVGKTSMARILAKAFNCLENDAGEPCGTCRVCKSIDGHGDALDVVEIDGASHNKVENVRDLIENLRFRPVEARYRIYIVDEVHMLSTAAFNALLKTLEEPPEHAKFILATTEPLKVPETIRSRCQMLDFQRLPTGVIAERLASICESEQASVPAEVTRAVARHAQGGLRDALSLLDQLLTYADGKPTLDDVHRLTGRLSPALVGDLVAAALAGELADVQRRTDAILGAGARPADVVAQLTEFLEGLLVVCAGGAVADRSDEEVAAFAELGARTHVDHVLAMLDVLVEAAHRLRMRHDGRLVVEMAALTLARLPHLQSLEALLAGAAEGGAAKAASGEAPARQVAAVRTPPPASPDTPPKTGPSGGDAWSTDGGGPSGGRRPARGAAASPPSRGPRAEADAPPQARAQPSAAGSAAGAQPEPTAAPAPAAAPTDFRGRLLEAVASRALRLELLRYRALEVQGDVLLLVPPPEGLAPLLDPSQEPHRTQLLAAAAQVHGAPLRLELRAGAPRAPARDPNERDRDIDGSVRRLWPGAERVDF
ncbi:MAG: DNA polymerase III subunit gamma/tau [Planctomycetes bacterium]|nr:DNA polymerase III subunit gamma/tau [Planctomycetota bacterium]